MSLEAYHYVWLLDHPNRTFDWLLDRLKDGFHIHHIDGNHDNNHPKNLVLIEGIDHFRLHGTDLLKSVSKSKRGRIKRKWTDIVPGGKRLQAKRLKRKKRA